MVPVCTCVCVCVFLSVLTSAPAIPVIWYPRPVVYKNIQYSLQSLQMQKKEKKKCVKEIEITMRPHVSTEQHSK